MPAKTRTINIAALSARMQKHPELAARFSAVLDLVDGAAGDIRNANTAEERAIEVLRDMGREAMQAWAARASQTAAAEARGTGRLELHLKKTSNGTPPTVR